MTWTVIFVTGSVAILWYVFQRLSEPPGGWG